MSAKAFVFHSTLTDVLGWLTTTHGEAPFSGFSVYGAESTAISWPCCCEMLQTESCLPSQASISPSVKWEVVPGALKNPLWLWFHPESPMSTILLLLLCLHLLIYMFCLELSPSLLHSSNLITCCLRSLPVCSHLPHLPHSLCACLLPSAESSLLPHLRSPVPHPAQDCFHAILEAPIAASLPLPRSPPNTHLNRWNLDMELLSPLSPCTPIDLHYKVDAIWNIHVNANI